MKEPGSAKKLIKALHPMLVISVGLDEKPETSVGASRLKGYTTKS